MKIDHISAATRKKAPFKYEGRDDDFILLLSGPTPDILKYKTDQNDNFIIYAITESRDKLVVNEIGPAEGESILPKGVLGISISGPSSWSIEVTAK